MKRLIFIILILSFLVCGCERENTNKPIGIGTLKEVTIIQTGNIIGYNTTWKVVFEDGTTLRLYQSPGLFKIGSKYNIYYRYTTGRGEQIFTIKEIK